MKPRVDIYSRTILDLYYVPGTMLKVAKVTMPRKLSTCDSPMDFFETGSMGLPGLHCLPDPYRRYLSPLDFFPRLLVTFRGCDPSEDRYKNN